MTHERRCLLQMALPPLCMLLKLLQRKEIGKRPFPETFDYDGKRKAILDERATLEEGVEEGLCSLPERRAGAKKIQSICEEAMTYIQTESLKDDFRWIAATFRNVENLFSQGEKEMKKYEEWKDREVLIDLRNRFATCYRNPDGSIFYIEPQFYTYLQGYKMLRPESYHLLLEKMDEVVKKNKKVVFIGQEENPLVECEGAIYLTAIDIANFCKVLVEDKSCGSDYGD